MRVSAIVFFTAVLFGLVISIGCSDTAMNCAPGLQQACPCGGESERMGIQVCADDGMSLGVCTGCPGEAVCEPGELQVCPCAGGGTGVQECDGSGTSWGSCEGCGGSADGDADGDSDSDSDSDADSDADCAYVDCEGDICGEPEDCCAAAGCGSWFFSDASNYIENYCYPMCDTSADDDPCKCGDACVDLDGMPVCLGTGRLVLDGFTTAVGEDSESYVEADPSTVNVSATHDGEAMTLSYFESYWYSDGTERDLAIWAQGQAGSSSAWMVGLYIPEDVFNLGPGEYPLIDEEEQAYNFYLYVYLGEYNSDGIFVDVWRENILNAEEATLTIGEVCEPCPAGASSCEECVFSADISWFAMRSKISMD